MVKLGIEVGATIVTLGKTGQLMHPDESGETGLSSGHPLTDLVRIALGLPKTLDDLLPENNTIVNGSYYSDYAKLGVYKR